MSENTNNTAALSEVTAAADQATEVGGVLESALPATTADQVAHIRALNKQGESVNITPGQVTELVPYVRENLILKSDTHQSIGAGFLQYKLSQHPVTGEDVTITLESQSSSDCGYTMAFITEDDVLQPNIYEGILSNGKAIYTFKLPDYKGKKVVELAFGISSPGVLNPRVKLEIGSKATPYIPNSADIARAMDYSLLTEQIVPGEFWLGEDGVKKQVYTCTFKAVWTLPAIGVWDGMEGVVASDVIDCFGWLRADGIRMSLTNPIYGIEFQMIFTNGKMSPQIRATSATYAGKPYTYVIAIKYLK